MTSLLVFIGIIIFFALSVYVWNSIQRRKGVTEDEPTVNARPDGCCGAHAVCEHTAEELSQKPDYFDDEELDRFKRKYGHEYTDEEAEEFKDIFYTIYDEEKSLWLRSLRMRHISLPDQVKQEILQVMKSIQKEQKTA